jgi:hypothetical protein
MAPELLPRISGRRYAPPSDTGEKLRSETGESPPLDKTQLESGLLGVTSRGSWANSAPVVQQATRRQPEAAQWGDRCGALIVARPSIRGCSGIAISSTSGVARPCGAGTVTDPRPGATKETREVACSGDRYFPAQMRGSPWPLSPSPPGPGSGGAPLIGRTTPARRPAARKRGRTCRSTHPLRARAPHSNRRAPLPLCSGRQR